MPVFPSKLSTDSMKCLPLFLRGAVVKGFGRGSKQLGIPTANFPAGLVSRLPKELECGVYYGWAAVDDSRVHKMVMSVGWNPYYKNEKKSVETHIMHHFDGDFYGGILRVIVLGFLRPEKNFQSLEELVAAIKGDISEAEAVLEGEEPQRYKTHPFFGPDQLTPGDEVVRSA